MLAIAKDWFTVTEWKEDKPLKWNQNIWETYWDIDTHESSDLWTVVAKCDSFSIPANGTVVDEGADVFKSAVLAHEVMQVIAVRII